MYSQQKCRKNIQYQPVSICQTWTVPSVQPITTKSSWGRHLTVSIGNRCREAIRIHLFSRNDSNDKEWSLATAQIQDWTRIWNKYNTHQSDWNGRSRSQSKVTYTSTKYNTHQSDWNGRSRSQSKVTYTSTKYYTHWETTQQRIKIVSIFLIYCHYTKTVKTLTFMGARDKVILKIDSTKDIDGSTRDSTRRHWWKHHSEFILFLITSK